MQKQVLNFIKGIIPIICRFPTSREMQQFFGWKSQTAAIVHLRALEKKGHIKKSSGREGGRSFFRLSNYALKLIPLNKMTECGYNRIRDIATEILSEKNRNFHTDPLIVAKFERIKKICDEETFNTEDED